jgi:signal transduction histidine kinase
MVNELLDEAQIESNSIKLKLKPLEISAMLEKVVTNLHILAAQKGLKLITHIDPQLPKTLIGDEQRLRQILINLMANAVKFTAEGEIRLDLLKAQDHHWLMQVSDTGIGIPKEAQTYIFEPFRQVDTSLTGNNGGTGLGLSIAKQLVELMGGQISLKSEAGQGSIFTIMMPMIEVPEKNL